jgi:translation initiation factor IF-2
MLEVMTNGILSIHLYHRLKEEELNIKRALQKQKLAELEAAKSSQDVMSKANNTGGAAAAVMVDTPVVATAAPSSSTVHVVIKADGVCTLEALKKVVSNIAARALEYVRVEVVGSSVGDITSSDLDLLSSGDKGLVLGFNVNILDGQTRSLAKQLDIAVCRDNVIYRLEDELVRVMSEYLPKERVLEQEVVLL